MHALHVHAYYIRLFHSNEQVANYNNDEQLTRLEHPIELLMLMLAIHQHSPKRCPQMICLG